MAANLKTLVQRGIPVAGDANVSNVRLGFAPAMGKPPAKLSYPVQPQRSVSAVVEPSWRHVIEHVAVRAGRSGSDAGNLASQGLDTSRLAIQLGWPTAEGRMNDQRDRLMRTSPLTTPPTANAALTARCLVRGITSAAPSVSTRGFSGQGYCQTHAGKPKHAHGTRIPPQAGV
jgi:hypothetical protein